MNSTLASVNDILEQYWQQLSLGQSQTLFLHCPASLTLESVLNHFSQTHQGEAIELQLFRYSSPSLFPAFYEITAYIRDLCQQQHIAQESLLAHATQLQHAQHILKALLQHSIPKRSEPLLMQELAYETSQLEQAILQMLLYLSEQLQRPMLLCFDRVELASDNVWQLVQRLQNALPGRILFVISLDTHHHFNSDSDNDSFHHFLANIELTRTIIDVPLNLPDSTEPAIPAYTAPVSQLSTLQSCLDLIQINNATYCFKTALSLITHTLSQFEHALDDTQRLQLYLQAGDACFYASEPHSALHYYEKVAQYCQQAKLNHRLLHALLGIAATHISTHNLEEAGKLAQQCLKLAREMTDEQLELRTYLTLYWIAETGSDPITDNHYVKLCQLLEQFHWQGTLAYIYKKSYTYHNYFHKHHSYHDALQLFQTRCQQAIDMYQALGNEYGLACALQEMGVVTSLMNDFHQAIQVTRRSADLRIQLNQPVEIVQACNGMGYLYTLLGDYQHAHVYYKEAIDQVWKLRNYNELTASLFNMAFLYLHCRDFDSACELFEKTLQIMQILKMKCIPFHSFEEINIMKAYCHIQLGQHLRALEHFNQVPDTESYQNSQTAFFHSMLKALLLKSSRQWQDATQAFEQARDALDDNIKSDQLLLPLYHLEFGLCHSTAQQYDAAQQQWSQGLALANLHDYPAYRHWFEQALASQQPLRNYNIGRVNVDLTALLELAKQETHLNKLHSKIREIRFLQTLQSIFTRSDDKLALAEQLIELIDKNFCCETIHLHLQNQNQWQLLAEKSNTQHNLSGHDVESLTDNPLPRLVTQLSHFYSSYRFNSAINIPLLSDKKIRGNLFLATLQSDLFLSEDDLEILTIAASQLMTVFEKIEREQQLFRISNTDALTGLFNRRAMQDKLKSEILRLERYGAASHRTLSLAFLDLDNFKYYNDEFGHDIGDLVIQEFAQLVCSVVRDVDIVARFGGDEFVITFPETSAKNATIACQRLLEQLEMLNLSLGQMISRKCSQPIHIPEDKNLGCSIGVANYQRHGTLDQSIEHLLKQADQGLYQAKLAGKNRVILVDDMS